MRRALAIAVLAAACSPSSAPGPTPSPSPTPSSIPSATVARPRAPRFALGRAPTAVELRDWAESVRPDGAGLPPGHGSVADGARVYAARCASCHGATGVEGPLDVLVGREPAEGYRLGGRPPNVAPVTIGNWWPRAAALFDYVRRAMPPEAPGSLGADDVYAVCAFLLHRNKIVPAGAVLDRESLSRVQLPGAARFVVDQR